MSIASRAFQGPGLERLPGPAYTAGLARTIGRLDLICRSDPSYLYVLARAIERFPILLNCGVLAEKQLVGKAWAVDTLLLLTHGMLGRVRVIAGWHGLLSAMLLNDNRLAVTHIESVDLEAECAPVATEVCAPWAADARFAAVTADAMACDYPPGRWNWIINTSCEHFPPDGSWWSLVPKGQRVLLQSNDLFAEANHQSCAHSVEEFIQQHPMSNVWFAGALAMTTFTRFMLVGEK
jgi:hypothetical protein